MFLGVVLFYQMMIANSLSGSLAAWDSRFLLLIMRRRHCHKLSSLWLHTLTHYLLRAGCHCRCESLID